jgi:hypothetical protein
VLKRIVYAQITLVRIGRPQESILHIDFSIVKGAEVPVEELKSLVIHEPDNRVFRALTLWLRGLAMALSRDFFVDS